ncbi:MAG: hypothetical protein K2M05_05040 [Paramuribaculum sp.]|nr:hypothetical protein [Paramuribaculum sp.]MDE6303344.1 hypothetical protein [Paramuribaculum sp.]
MSWKIFVIAVIMSVTMTGFEAQAQQQAPCDTLRLFDKSLMDITIVRKGHTVILQATELGDSLVINSPIKFVVDVDANPSDNIDLFSETWGIEMPFFKKKPIQAKNSGKCTRTGTFFNHAYWGQRFNYNNKGRLDNSYEIGVRSVLGVKWKNSYSNVSFATGLGFGMVRTTADRGYIYMKDQDKLILGQVPEPYAVQSTSLNVWRFHVPLMMTVPLGEGVKLTLGGVVNLNSYAKANSQIVTDNTRVKACYKGLQQRLLTCDIYGSFTICGIGVYATWSPMTLFQSQFGPDVMAWSIGADIFTF